MGKRELVLIALFAVAGILIYQVTAPPLPAGQEGFSVSRMLQNMRRGMQGRRARAVVESTRTEPVGAEISELRANLRAGDLTVLGEDRADAAFSLSVSSNGSDEEDAKRLAGLVVLKIERAASGLIFSLDYPREGLQQATLVVRVPRRLSVRVEAKSGRLEVSDLAAVTVKGNRGDMTVKNIAGEADLTQRGAALKVSHVASLRLSSVNSEGEIADVLGIASLDFAGVKAQVSGIVGPLELKSRNSEVRLRDAAASKPPLRIDMQSGELDVEQLRTEARIDGRNTEIRLTLDKPAPLTVYNTGEDIVVAPPAGGYTLDAVAIDGDIASEDTAIKITGDERERRAAGAVHGGGPALTLRATRGRIELRRAVK